MTPRWTALNPHPVQSAFLVAAIRDKVRQIALPCGRQSGKSELAKRRLVLALTEEKSHGKRAEYLVGMPTESQCVKIWWDDIVDLIPKAWVIKTNRGTPHFIETRVGEVRAKIQFVGLHAAASVEGQGLDGALVDESSDILPGVVDRTLRPMLDSPGRDGWMIRLGVPKRFAKGAGKRRLGCVLLLSGRSALLYIPPLGQLHTLHPSVPVVQRA